MRLIFSLIMKNKMLRKAVGAAAYIAAVFLLLQLLYTGINNPVIFPSPFEVAGIMAEQITDPQCIDAIAITILRVSLGIAASFLTGAVLGIVRFFYPWTSRILDRFVLLLRSLPNITLIILFLFWFDGESCIFFVICLVLFPLVYQACADSLVQIGQEWKDLFAVYSQPRLYLLKKIYLPLLKPDLGSALISVSSLGFKVGVMAEILSQVRSGIGRSMQIAKLNIDIASLFAWTAWLLIVVFVYEQFVKKLIRICFK